MGWLLAGCSGRATPQADALVVAAPRGWEAAALQAAADAYSTRAGQTIRVVGLGRDEYAGEIAAVLLAGLDRYDLVYLPAESLARWAKYHAIQPVSLGYDPDLAAWLPAATVDGAVYGLPAQVSIEVLWYRADLFAAAGLPAPATWEEARSAAEALSAPPERYGMALAGGEMDTAAEFAALLAGFGGQAVTPDHQVMIASATARAALTWYGGLFAGGRIAPPDSLTATRARVVERLAKGQAALAIAPLDAQRRLHNCEESPAVCQDGVTRLAWTWLPGLPASVSTGALQVWAVPKRAGRAQEAWAFARWLVSGEGARVWASEGGLPANRGALHEHAPGGDALGRIETHYLALPAAVGVDQLWQIYHAAVHAALSGTAAPGFKLESAAREMEITLYQDDY